MPIPEPDDYPFIGQWPAARVPAALVAFRSLDLTGIDEEMAETLPLIRAWLEAAAKTPGAAVIGFLS